ncbi:MAG: DUF305 domain-containing protein [Homoserinimonas sp.]
MDPEKSPKQPLSTRLIVGIILGATVIAAGSFTAGFVAAPVTPTPGSTSTEAGFSRDMQTHHIQAVEMSMILLDRTEDTELRMLAEDIATAQQQQAGQMYAWLSIWGVPQAAPEPSMTWMTRPTLDGANHDHGGEDGETSHVPGEPMPGLATAEQLQQLKSLAGVPAESYYLELMIAHHIGGVDMAQAVLDRSTNRAVTSLARGMVAVQQGEIAYMNELLAERA